MNERGFTLIEIAVVLIVVGIMIGVGTGLIGPLTKRVKLNETRQAGKSAREALLGYAVKNGYLPSDTGSDPLGSAGARTRDAWGSGLVYFADNALEGIGADVCSVSSTDFIIYVCQDEDCTNYDTMQNIAFIVFSKGEDRNGAGTSTAVSGSGSPCPSYTMPSCASGKTCFYIRDQGACYEYGGAEYRYDDIVYNASVFEIQSARQCN